MKRKRLVLALALVLGAGGSVFAQYTVSAGMAIDPIYSYFGEGLEGGNLCVDYLLPISVPVSAGVEIVYLYHWGSGILPLMARAAYHLDLLSRLDLFVVGKIGYAAALEDDEKGGLALGIDIGMSFYFSSMFGAFIEAGYDKYNLKYERGQNSGQWEDYPQYRILTVGISFKK